MSTLQDDLAAINKLLDAAIKKTSALAFDTVEQQRAFLEATLYLMEAKHNVSQAGWRVPPQEAAQ